MGPTGFLEPVLVSAKLTDHLQNPGKMEPFGGPKIKIEVSS